MGVALRRPVDSLPVLIASAIFASFALVTFVTFWGLDAEEPRVWGLPAGIPSRWVADFAESGICCSDLRPTAFLSPPDAQGEIRVDIRHLDVCQPWQGGKLVTSLFWLPQASSQLEAYLKRIRQNYGDSARFMVAPDDKLKHEHVIAFLDALRGAGARFLEFVDPEDSCR
jgi:hypothetical protein